ncbi:MAG: hypothetical protein IPL95_08270 [Saprospiraceae bacterium]|nr:hypothetical protein [Saprospiraceae bacterium]
MPIVQNQDSLLNIALDAFQAAIQLDSNAAYIQNELGVIYQLKMSIKSPKLYLKATTMAPTGYSWANHWVVCTFE